MTFVQRIRRPNSRLPCQMPWTQAGNFRQEINSLAMGIRTSWALTISMKVRYVATMRQCLLVKYRILTTCPRGTRISCGRHAGATEWNDLPSPPASTSTDNADDASKLAVSVLLVRLRPGRQAGECNWYFIGSVALPVLVPPGGNATASAGMDSSSMLPPRLPAGTAAVPFP